MQRYSFGVNEQGVETFMEVHEDGTIITEDRQSAGVIQAILDRCADARRKEAEGGVGFKDMKWMSALPVTIFTNLRRMWDAKYREYMNWHEFYFMMIEKPGFKAFKCTNKKLSCPQHLKEVDTHAYKPSLPTAANFQREREEQGMEFSSDLPDFMPLTSNDDSIRLNC